MSRKMISTLLICAIVFVVVTSFIGFFLVYNQDKKWEKWSIAKAPAEKIMLMKIDRSDQQYRRNFAVSDIHGRFASFKKALSDVHFSKSDRLFVLGDSIDRGPDGFDVLLYLTKTLPDEGYHVVVLTGNHEDMWQEMADKGTTDAERMTNLESEINSYGSNVPNGWNASLADWKKLNASDRTFILSELTDGFGQPRQLLVEISGEWYSFSHSANFKKTYNKQSAYDLSWSIKMSDTQVTFRNSLSKKLGVPTNDIQVLIGHIGGHYFGIHPNYICLDDTQLINFDKVPVQLYDITTRKFEE